MAGNHFEAVVSQFVLSTCLLGSHRSVPACLCLTLVILEGSIDVLTCTSSMALGDGLSLDVSVFICFCHFAVSFEEFSLACAPLLQLTRVSYFWNSCASSTSRILSYVTEVLWSRQAMSSRWYLL
jgi:hypothetical protein